VKDDQGIDLSLPVSGRLKKTYRLEELIGQAGWAASIARRFAADRQIAISR